MSSTCPFVPGRFCATLVALCFLGLNLVGVGAQAPLRPELALQIGHLGPVWSVAFSPDGKTLASGSSDKIIKLWDAQNGIVKRTLQGHRGIVNTVCFAPDGTTLASGSDDKTIKLWDVQNGVLQRTLQGHRDRVLSICFAPDGKTLASGSRDGTIKLWDARMGGLQRTLVGHGDAVNAICFSPDGETLASSSLDQTIKLWDAQSGVLRRTLVTHVRTWTICFAPDGRTLASSGDDTVKLWNVQSGALQRTLRGHHAWVNAVVFSPDGKSVASGSNDRTIKLWDARSGALKRTLSGRDWLRPKDCALNIVNAVVFSPDGKTLASGNLDQTINLWDAQSGVLRRVLGKPVSDQGQGGAVDSVCFAPDGKTLAIGSWDATVKLWDAHSGALKGTLQGHRNIVRSICFAPDGKTLASGGDDGTVKLWNVQGGALRRTLQGQGDWVNAVCFSPDGRTLASGTRAGTISLWNARTGALKRTWGGYPDWVNAVCFAPDGKTLASGHDNGTIKLWNAASGVLQHTLHGNSLNNGSAKGAVKSWNWNVMSGLSELSVHGQRGSARSISFASDGKTLASGHDDGTIKLWNARTGALQHTLRGHGDIVQSVCFAPDGRTLASGSFDQTIKLWDAHSGVLQRTLREPDDWVLAVCFSPDGKTLAAGIWNQTIKEWTVQNGRLLATLLTLPEGDETVQSAAKGLIVLGDKGLIVLGSKGASQVGTLKPGTLADKKLAGTGDEWFAMTPEGWFDCSANAARFARWRTGNELFPAERYWRKFRRPDLVRQALRGEAVPEPEFSAADLPPVAHFVALRYNVAADAVPDSAMLDDAVSVTIETRSRHEVSGKDVTLLVNDRPLPLENAVPQEETVAPASAESNPVPGGKPSSDMSDRNLIELGDKGLIVLGDKPIDLGGKPVPGGSGGADTIYTLTKRFTFQVPLPLGAQEVRLRALAYDSAGLGSEWAQMVPLSRPSAKPVPGNLYALCVGLQDYKNADGKAFKNLNFAADDALSIAERLKREAGGLYQHVEVFPSPGSKAALLNKEATLDNIRAGLKWLQAKARPGQIDTVVVFLSGHGFSDAQGSYHFPTYDFDPSNKSSIEQTSLSGRELQDALGGKLRAKDVFLFVDTCHSGALAGARNDDLSFDVKSSGIYMMASSGSAQSSYEYPGWKHGAFTLALLKSLGRQELARDGAIRFDVLTYAVPDEIARLLQAAQQNAGAETPVVPLEGRTLDVPVVRPQ